MSGEGFALLVIGAGENYAGGELDDIAVLDGFNVVIVLAVDRDIAVIEPLAIRPGVQVLLPEHTGCFQSGFLLFGFSWIRTLRLCAFARGAVAERPSEAPPVAER